MAIVLVNSTQTLDELGLGSLLDEFDASTLLTAPATEVGTAPDRQAVAKRSPARGLRRLDGKGDHRGRRHGHPGTIPQGRQRRPSGTSLPPQRSTTTPGKRWCSADRGCSVFRQIEGSRAVAETVALCRPEVVCAYPISPQTHIIEAIGATREDRRAGAV